ncbi:hypothetical protein [Amnibacterium endophyticum]|uniref:Uncharacterized protein n=1 Tax=Amnibacterium endophyticum TaxID=2109337 RepID=A0ABW4LCN6_9MICO
MRSWAGLAAIGAGLVHLGIAAGSDPLALVLLTAAGAAEVLWGIVDLARPEASRGAAALGVLALLVGAQVVLLVAVGHAHATGAVTAAPVAPAAPVRSVLPPAGATAGAAVLDLIATAALALRLRRGSGAEPGPARFLVGTAAAALVVAAIAATSLAGTAVGAGHVH